MAWYQGPPTPAERPSSPQPQTNAQDDIAMPGFGIEFEHSLKRAWEDHEDKERGRLAKYSRFGMTEEEARRATPEHMREAYKTLVADQLADVYTPSPSPSPSPSIPPTPRSIEFNHPNIADAYSTYQPLQQDSKENHSRPTIHRNGPSHQHIKQQSTPDPAASRPVKPIARIAGTRGKVVVGSKIAKRPRTYRQIQVRNTPQSRHHMETRSRKLARKSGFS
ncbi:hypothetical protein LCER1_G009114 [Lachnellula cervina]|uniref:Uncharacterized protein n=1 Tax=Lachnellula cervina TaxID=1316786 RepID=A0A7D8YY88_9HELO|nr:hypothetical protein LCER1_G009114 [Lachnellula cervina]